MQNIIEQTEEDQKFLTIENNFSEWRYQFSPEFAAMNGMEEKANVKGKLDDNSLESVKEEYEKSKEVLKQLNQLDINKLKQQLFSFKILKNLLECHVNNFHFETYYCCLNQYESPWNNFLHIFGSKNCQTKEDFQVYNQLLQQLPRQIQQNLDILKEGLKKNIVPPQISMKGAIASAKMLSAFESADKTPFFKPYLTYQGEKSEIQELQNQAVIIIENDFKKIMQELLQFLETEYFPKCRVKYACKHSFEGNEQKGIDMYQKLISIHTTFSKYDAKQIHEIGLQEIERIRKQCLDIMNKENFKEDDLRKFYNEYMFSKKEYFVKNKEEIISYTKDIAGKIEKKLKDYFLFDMNDIQDYEIQPMEPHMEKSGPPAYYYGNSEKGRYVVNTYEPENRALYGIPAITLHEAIPGHHFQTAYFQDLKNIPKTRLQFDGRRYFAYPGKMPQFTGFQEGWGLYCEYLGEEMGIYENQYELFGRYTLELLRACRLVVDTGIHCFDWTYEQAVELMMKNTCESEQTVTQEVKRYIQFPGQALGYKIGEIKIHELRKRAQDILKDKFCLKHFHQTILDLGPVPLDLLEEQIDLWIQSNQ